MSLNEYQVQRRRGRPRVEKKPVEKPKRKKRAEKPLPKTFKEMLDRTADTPVPVYSDDGSVPEHSEALKHLRSAERLLKARQARNDLIAFGELMMPDPQDPDDPHKSRYDAQYFHKAVAATLQEVEAGRIKRLLITFPPRHGKSQLTSRFFPAWFLGRNPYRHMMFATYNEPFAEDFGRDVRAIMQSDAYSQVFPKFEFRQGSTAANRLQSKEGGLAAFVGRGGSITGRGADLLVIDDPIKDHVEAASVTVRNDTWEWFNNTAMTRLMTDESCVIIIMTRWHEDDLIGRLTDPTNPHFNADEAKAWKIINIPAIAEAGDVLGRKVGEALWPSRFGIDYLSSIKSRNPRGFSALYQQRPSPEDGDHFTRDMIRGYVPHDLPKKLRIYASSDHAVKLKQHNDFTVLLIVGVDEMDNIWLLDCWRGRMKTDKVVELMIDMMEKWRPLIWWAAKDHIAESIGPFLYRRMKERRVYCSISQLAEKTGDKVQKSQAIHGRMSMGMVRFPTQAPWFEEVRSELLKFPNGKFDDFVDTLSNIGRGLRRMIKAASPEQELIPKGPKTGTFGWVKAAHLKQKQQSAENRVLRGG